PIGWRRAWEHIACWLCDGASRGRGGRSAYKDHTQRHEHRKRHACYYSGEFHMRGSIVCHVFCSLSVMDIEVQVYTHSKAGHTCRYILLNWRIYSAYPRCPSKFLEQFWTNFG